jgi:hypothetical protein
MYTNITFQENSLGQSETILLIRRKAHNVQSRGWLVFAVLRQGESPLFACKNVVSLPYVIYVHGLPHKQQMQFSSGVWYVCYKVGDICLLSWGCGILQDGDNVNVLVVKPSINLALYKSTVFSLARPSLNLKECEWGSHLLKKLQIIMLV